MEKFAIDLDKVLDDFELDEDVNDRPSHHQYDRLQLEFQNEIDDPCNLGAVGGSINTVTEETSPCIDSAICQSGSNPISQITSLESEQIHLESSSSTFQSEEPIYPRHSNSIPPLSHGIDLVTETSDRNISDFSSINYHTASAASVPESNYRPVDVISSASHSYGFNEDSQQPDILDLKQNSSEDNLVVADHQDDVIDIEVAMELPRESLVLPDIMSNSTTDRVDLSNDHQQEQFDIPVAECIDPAVVTENSLGGFHNNEPAIVQESQSCNRIPEIVNIHQSAENMPSSCWRDRLLDRPNNVMDESMQNRISPNRILPDISTTCITVRESEVCNSDVVRFDPNLNVPDDNELDAELQELEEEQASLQGAYRNNPQLLDDLIGNSARCEEKSLESSDMHNPQQQSPDLIENVKNNFERNAEDLVENCDEQLQCVSSSFDVEQPTTEVSLERNDVAVVTEEALESDSTTEENEVLLPPEDASSESSATDTGSTSTNSTLPEREALPEAIVDSESSVNAPIDADSRDTPGSLVTAVYDDSDKGEGSTKSEEEKNNSLSVGFVAPFWVPDDQAANCQECGVKFTLVRRRHHCRGCGRVLCSPCCHFKTALAYMDYKEARVCNPCLQVLTSVSGREESYESVKDLAKAPNPNNPMEYCSRIPPQQQVGAQSGNANPTVMVPSGVLKRENSTTSNSRVNKQVIFSDGIRPGGDLSELAEQEARPSSPFRRMSRTNRRANKNIPEYIFDSKKDLNGLEEKMSGGKGPPVIFALHKNLSVLVQKVKLDCCVGLEVWNVATRGLCNVGQEELVVLLEVISEEKSPPPHIFAFFHTIYQEANKGNLVTELGHSIFTEPEGFLGSKEHGGFLYVRPTFQCLHKLVLPPSPYLFAILIQKWETPWAKVFPLRLMLRLGAEFRYYPCPLVSSRNRKPVYCEIGHTIMNLLVDFRNYAYTVATIEGFVIHMEDKKTTLVFPKNRYQQVWKALNNSNDHVLALGANFSPLADSHLVTVEDDDGHYTTQAINIHNKPRKVTGASFVVFNGALKSNSGLKAKSSIVEDGLMVQIPGEMMTNLRESLRNMKDLDIPCGPSSASEPDELVAIRWGAEDKNFNIGIRSPVDNKPMDGIPSVKIHSGIDYISNDLLIRWTEVFIIKGEASTGNSDINISRLAETLARACCVALTPHVELLYGSGPNRLALRATMHQDNVGYESGMGGKCLLSTCMNELDAELVPVIHRAAANITDEPIILELLFHIMQQ